MSEMIFKKEQCTECTFNETCKMKEYKQEYPEQFSKNCKFINKRSEE